MLSVVKPRERGIRAPQTASGTVTRITRGSLKLSNCAASTRKITMSAKPKEKVKRLPSVTYWRLYYSQSTVVPTENGRASCRERVCQNVYVSVVVVSLTKNKLNTRTAQSP